MIKSPVKYIAILIFMLAHPLGYTASVADNRVDLGIQALKTGDFHTAKQWLESAQKRSSQHPDLPNALGLTYLGLENRTLAKQFFKQALDTRRAHEAAYHLGQLAMDAQDFDSAKAWFHKAANQYEDIEVQRAADQALLKVELLLASGSSVEKSDFLRKFALIAFDFGEVRGLVNPDDTQGEDESDTNVALLMAGSTTLTSVANELDWKLGGSFYTERYSTFSAYDIDGYSVFSSINTPVLQYTPEFRAAVSRFMIDGEPYLDQLDLGLKQQWSLPSSRKLLVHGKLSSVDSPEATYAYYAGQLAEIGAELQGGDSPAWRLGITWRQENRDDQSGLVSNTAGDSFEFHTSYSRDWWRLRGRLNWSWTPKWRQKLEASWRVASYHDADRYLLTTSDTDLTVHQRDTVRWNLKAELSRSLTPTLDLNLKFEHMEDDSNDNRYDFDSQSVSAGMSYLF